uniref:Uncharacterized protein n=1 Tax=Anguilla anguilla TaxID=7936 RepID=A0A0E9UWK0_ANGAN
MPVINLTEVNSLLSENLSIYQVLKYS